MTISTTPYGHCSEILEGSQRSTRAQRDPQARLFTRLLMIPKSQSAFRVRAGLGPLTVSCELTRALDSSIVVFLRLLTSAFLQAHADEYTPFLFAVDGNDVAQIMDPETGMPDMKRFCGWCVEVSWCLRGRTSLSSTPRRECLRRAYTILSLPAMFHLQAVNKEADHLQIVAITRALGVHTRVAYLDPSHSINATAGGGGVDTEGTACDWVLFQEDAEESLDAALLYREFKVEHSARQHGLVS